MIMGLFVLPLVPALFGDADPFPALPGEQLGAQASTRACAQSPAGPGWHRPGAASRFPPDAFILSSSLLKLPLHLILLRINI